MLVAIWRLCQDKETILPEACDAAVKLAVQRLKMYQEDAVVAHQVLKPPPKKKDKKSEEKKSEEGEWSFHITFGCESCTFLYVDHGSCHATGCNHLEFKVYSSGWQNFPISLYAIYIYIICSFFCIHVVERGRDCLSQFRDCVLVIPTCWPRWPRRKSNSLTDQIQGRNQALRAAKSAFATPVYYFEV